MGSDLLIPLERQISNLQKEVDVSDWEGRSAKGAEQELKYLIQQLNEGEVWYPLF